MASRLQRDLIRVVPSQQHRSQALPRSATPGNKAGTTVAMIVAHEDVDTDEFELDSDFYTDAR